jgi:Tol biopolymer transport system component
MGGADASVWVIPTAGVAPQKIVAEGKDAIPSPDGARIALTSPDESVLWVAAADGSAPRQIRSGGQVSSFSSVIWSPDGKRVAYQRRDLEPGQRGQTPVDKAQLVKSYRVRVCGCGHRPRNRLRDRFRHALGMRAFERTRSLCSRGRPR